MKNLFLVILLLIGFSIDAQEEHTSFYFVQSPGSWEDGYSFGVGFEYEVGALYIAPELYIFPNLNDLTYAHAMGRIGAKVEVPFRLINYFDTLRFHGGTRLGFIYRETGGMNYANIGFEAGIQYTHNSGWYLRAAPSIDWRTDSKIWSNDDYFQVKSVWLTIGKRF